MPIYEYRCEKCRQVFSVLQSMGAKEKDTVCTECGSSKVRKQVSSCSCSTSTAGGFSGGSFAGGSGGGFGGT